MKILLLFPPDWLPSEPYLSLPALTSVLRPAGHTVTQKDVNVEMYEMMFAAPFLRHVEQRISHELRHLRHVAAMRRLTAEEEELLGRLSACPPDFFAAATGRAARAMTVLRGPEFYDIDKLEWATGILHETMNVISLGYYPAQICFPPVETDLAYKPFISAEILEAVADEQINVYRDVYRWLVEPVIAAERPQLVGISIVQQKQLIPAFTFCRMIKDAHPDIHITLGGNIVTRIRDVLPQKPELFNLFDSAVVYEGETAFLRLVNAIESGEKDLSKLPNLMYRDAAGIHVNTGVCAENLAQLPPPDFDGLPLDKYFVPERILPYLATRGCYWGRCTFCDHFQGYTSGFRTKHVEQIMAEVRFLKEKHGNRHFHFTDESYPPALFRKLSRRLIDEKLDIAWTTHMRFEEILLDDEVWKDAAAAGCKYLHFGYESGNERVLQLMDKATHPEAIRTNLRLSAQNGIWNHCMGFFGFPGETRPEAEDSMRFLEENKEHVHSIGFMTFVLGKHSPVAMEPQRYGIEFHKNPEWDLALDYYFTPEKGLDVRQALEVFEEFERQHDPKWDLRTCVREYIFLYIDHFKTNNLTQLYIKPDGRREFHYSPVGMV